jgi:Cu/Ag efflux protein CusF
MRSWLARCLLVVAIATLACGSGGAEGAGAGTVRGIDRANATVTLEHGDIPGLMKAMTMTFEVADPKLLDAVEVGNEVDFRVRYADGKYTVTDVDPR